MERLFYCFGCVVLLVIINGEQTKNDTADPLSQSHTERIHLFYDNQTYVIVHKSRYHSKCYLNFNKLDDSISKLKNELNLLSINKLSKEQLHTLADSKIVKFCQGFPLVLLQKNLLNEDSWKKESDHSTRRKRSLQNYFSGRVRGQTQSQYLHYGNNGQQPGKAEAEATYGSSKAIVTGSNGMGQAQSQSSPYGCDDCYGVGIPGPGQILQPIGPPQGPTYGPGGQIIQPGAGPTFGPGGQIFQPDQPGTTGPTYGPGGQVMQPSKPGPAGPTYGPSGQIFQPSQPGVTGPTYGPGGQVLRPSQPGATGPTYGPGGQIFQPSQPGVTGPTYGPGGQALRPSKPGTSGPTYGPGGQIFQPSQPGVTGPTYGPGGLQPSQPGTTGPTYGPGGQIFQPGPTYGPGGQVLQPSQPGPTYGPGGQIFQPSQPGTTGPTYGPGGQILQPSQPGTTGPTYGPGSQIFQPSQPGVTGPTYGPGGQILQPGTGPTFGPGGQTFQPSQPGTTGPTYGPGGQVIYPGQLGGQFGGQFGGDYQHTSGRAGKFSGMFSGQYNSHGQQFPIGPPTTSNQPPSIYVPQSQGQKPIYIPNGSGVYTPGGQFAGTFSGNYNNGQHTGFDRLGSNQGPASNGPSFNGGPDNIKIAGGPSFNGGPGTGGLGVADHRYNNGPGFVGLGHNGGAGTGDVGTNVGSGFNGLGHNGGPGVNGLHVNGGQGFGGPGYNGGSGVGGHGFGGHAVNGGPNFNGGQGTGGTGFGGQGLNGDHGTGGTGFGGQRLNGAQGNGGVGFNGQGLNGAQGTGGTGFNGQGLHGAQGTGGAGFGGQGNGGLGFNGQGLNGVQGTGGTGFGGQGINVARGNGGTGFGGQGYNGGSGIAGPGYSNGVSGYNGGQGINGASQWPSNFQQMGDDADTQVQTSVQQINNETQASASAQGTYQGGNAQSQVSGVYSGSGSFSASAGTNDGKRGAETQVAGGKHGGTSSAQGLAGVAQSQAQVEFASDTGQTSANAQTSGWNHGTNTQLQGGIKGGMADAQANGPGSTSSQAQIGFIPYDEDEVDEQQTPFKGGGTAGAQSGTHLGQSQVQLQGKFYQGIRYVGSAQAGSGNGLQNANQTQFGNFKLPSIKPIGFSATTVNKSPNIDHTLNKSEEIKNEVKEEITPTTQYLRYRSETTTALPSNNEYSVEEYEYDDDYENEKPSATVIRQTTDSQKQHILLDPLEDIDAVVMQAQGDPDLPEGTVLQPGQKVPGTTGYQIPQGFRGVVKAVSSGPYTAATGRNSQAQSVSLIPGTGEVIYKQPVYSVSSHTGNRNGRYSYGSGYTYQPIKHQLKAGVNFPNFISTTKSETGYHNIRTGKRVPSVYYSQSSSCGYFTNTCVYNGRTKICMPKPKTNPDGTPIVC